MFAFLAIFIALTVAGPLPHKDHNGGHGQATSYAVVTKHNDNEVVKYDDHADSHGFAEQVEYHGGNDGYHGHDDHYGHEGEHDGDYNSHPKYEFAYGVEDHKTGDIKEQWESRDGSYSLKESDGTTRLVTYTSDKKTGFEATVHKIGQASHDHSDAEYSHKHGY
ncbi:uncharacterized protein LOC133329707 [Musca vetustissima]|uniref:uncharacterized protein LOC133329707 n=1 Tax=Musca vetustissima TaxID=27455 RepID=UPI002AB6BD90|nr:uncharacterized protein LOC133329707 [Musca vetustissima]